MSVERWAVTFYGAHNERHEEPLPSLQGLCEWGIYLDWQGWLIDRTHPIYQSCQHVERHRWPFKANVSFRRSDFKKKSNGITIRSVFNNIDKWTIWRISESTYFPMVPEFRKIIAFWNIPRLCPSVFLGGIHVAKDVCGALVKWYWQGKQKYCEKNLSQCHFIHHKSYMDWPGIENRPPQWDTANWPPEPWHGLI